MKSKLAIVLDTNIFVNPDSYRFFGLNPDSALVNFLTRLKEKSRVFCYIPPSVYEELTKFLEKKIPSSLSVLLKKQPPASYQTQLPALFIYEFIEEIRQRINKGLRVAEKFTRKALKEKDEPELIKALREEHRLAMREGMLDSKEDFDLLLLAKELGAYLATTDQGLIIWAKKLGISCLNPEELNALIN